MKSLLLVATIILSTVCNAQSSWYNPQKEGAKLHGQLMQSSKRANYYQRLPDVVKADVRDAVWSLSSNAAGQSLKFRTNSSQIVVKYVVEEVHSMTHMAATGKSGVDLYARDQNGVVRWCGARRSFGDTISYTYSSLRSEYFDYELDLPPYNTVLSLEIGVDESAGFKFLNPTEELPIIAYGTSITQGACASRPGMIWASIIRRELEIPLINLGFSGNGRLEKGLLDVIKSTPAKLIILDCLPNIHHYKVDKIVELTINAVEEIRKSQPSVPIILTDHLGYPHYAMTTNTNTATSSNKANLESYQRLLEMGYSSLYHLTFDEIAMPEDATVEGIHPTDYGMRVYADAYIKKIRDIVNMPKGEFVTERAVTQQRDPYNWMDRHASILSSIKASSPKVVVLGNSIMHQWGGVESTNYPSMRGRDSWDEVTKDNKVINMGAGWDLIENVLWRVYHGALDGFDADRVIVAIGVNNLSNRAKYSEDDITEGIRNLIVAIKLRQTKAEIKICGIFPMRSSAEEIKMINKRIKEVAKEEGVLFGDPGAMLLLNSGEINPSLFQNDRLHLNAKGYNKISKEFFK